MLLRKINKYFKAQLFLPTLLFNSRGGNGIGRHGLQTRASGVEQINDGFHLIKFPQFTSWHNEITKNGHCCHYCGISNEESLILFNLRPYATRGGKRGKRLELDRKNPQCTYDNLQNLVWACYWSNNAKSNFFFENEFTPLISTAIGEVLKSIIKSNNQGY